LKKIITLEKGKQKKEKKEKKREKS